jgi:hypothetical protein
MNFYHGLVPWIVMIYAEKARNVKLHGTSPCYRYELES